MGANSGGVGTTQILFALVCTVWIRLRIIERKGMALVFRLMPIRRMMIARAKIASTRAEQSLDISKTKRNIVSDGVADTLSVVISGCFSFR